MKSSIAVAAVLALASLAAARPARRCSAHSSSTHVPTSTEAPPTSTEAPPTSTEAPPISTPTPPPSGGGGGKGPIFSVYADVGISADAWPKASDMGKWNDLLLAFYLTDGRGAFDISAVWAGLGNDTQKSIIDDYHAAKKNIRVSLFGATDFPLTRGGDPKAIAAEVATFVKNNNLDGVDLDYEDSASFNANGDGETFLITLTKELRAALPSPQYILSHAPQSPYFTSAGWYPQGAYIKVDKEVGSMIDFYNIQFYNQGQGMYEDCTSLFTGGGTTIAGTSVGEIIKAGIPAHKVIIGKPGGPSEASNGFMDPATLGGCIANSDVKPGGVMSWQWQSAKADWIEAANGGL